MKYQISYEENGQLIKKYQPKANPLACFKGQCDERRPSYQTEMIYRTFSETEEKEFNLFVDLLDYLNRDSDGEKVHTIRGYVNGNRQNIYVQLKAIED